MIHFDDVLSTTRALIDADSESAQIQHVTVLRDLRGRIRLFLKPKDTTAGTLAGVVKRLQPRLEKELGGFWGRVIETDIPGNEMTSLIDSVRSEAQPIPIMGFEKWSIIERHISKSSWLGKFGKAPWLLQEQTPAIVSFFSHKGGVGRTTALCAAAINLARAGHRVVVIDLDLEAPGIATLLSETLPALGVTDYLLERLLEHQSPMSDFLSVQNNQELIGAGGEPIRCVVAGQITSSYFEKLARLDYELFVNVQAEKNPMINLLKEIRNALSPSFIFWDYRAGLHDLGGLAVQHLSHLNVVFGLDSEPSWQGLRLVIQQLGRIEDRLPDCFTIQSLEPPPGEIRDRARQRFLTDSYKAFLEYYYGHPDAGPTPDIGDQDAPHYPFHIPYETALAGYRSLHDAAEILTNERFRDFTATLARRVGKPFEPKVLNPMAERQPQFLLDDLSQVAQGGIAELAHTQTDEDFFRYHMPIPEHRRILSAEILLILGGRGAGKSQLFQARRRLPNPEKLAVASRSSLPQIKSEDRIDYLIGFEKRGIDFPSAEDLSAALATDRETTPRLIWLGLLAGVLLKKKILTDQLPAELAQHLQTSLAYPKHWLKLLDQHNQEVNRALDNIEKKLNLNNAAIVATYDDLDVLAVRLTQVYPLVRELLAFWLDRSRRWTHLRCKIFLRTDIFNAEALSFADSSKLRPRSLALSWNPESLYWLLLKRLLNGEQAKAWKAYIESGVSENAWKKTEPWGIIPQTNGEQHQKIISKMIGTYMGTDPKRGETYRWFFNHLQDSLGMIAPRSFLKLFEYAAKRQLREGLNKLSPNHLLSPSQIQGALQEVSVDRIAELAEEYPWVSALKNSLAGNIVPMTREEFAGLLNQTQWENGAVPHHTQAEQLVDDLLKLGILRETEDQRIHVPDIYLYGFGLRRKGGIKRPTT